MAVPRAKLTSRLLKVCPVSIVAETLSRGIVKQARSLNAQLIVLKEFPSRYRSALQCFVQRGFARAPSMPMTILDIKYASFDAYMEKALKSSSRKKIRKKLEATAGVSDIRMNVTDDAASFVDEIYPLYLQVFERSRMQFERLTKEFFRQLGQRMSDKVRFFAWRRGNVLVAFSLCMVQGELTVRRVRGLRLQRCARSASLSLRRSGHDQLGDQQWLQMVSQQWPELRSEAAYEAPARSHRPLRAPHVGPCKCNIQAGAALDRAGALRRNTEAIFETTGNCGDNLVFPAIRILDPIEDIIEYREANVLEKVDCP